MIDLTPFYDPHDIREMLRTPFSDWEHTYATNGHIIVRVPVRADVAPVKDAADKTAALFSQHAIGLTRDWFDIPELPDAIMDACLDCDTSQGVCEECNGTGEVEKIKSADIGMIPFQRKYLAIIKALPGCKISPLSIGRPAWFKFDGGDGLLMPMRERR